MLYLNKGERGKGIGKFIISYLVNFYKFSEIIVRTAQKNKKAHKFYEKNGFSYCTNNSSEKVSVFYKKH
jgi:GNAT superfamily N-acetyltransferase